VTNARPSSARQPSASAHDSRRLDRGPYRIKSGLRGTDLREHGPFPLPNNERYPIPLEQSFRESRVAVGGQRVAQVHGVALLAGCASGE
jgi:hypothetical protein